MKKSYLIFYPKKLGGAVFIEKTKRENKISIFILVANFFTSEYVFFVAKLPYAIQNLLTIAIALFLECCSAESAIFLSKS